MKKDPAMKMGHKSAAKMKKMSPAKKEGGGLKLANILEEKNNG